jgi:hypothetical protein
MPTRATNEENVHSNLREGRVRWDEATASKPDRQSFTPSAGSRAAATPDPSRDGAKKFSSTKKKFEKNAVAAYHFEGVPNTPWSKKKNHHAKYQHGHSRSIGERELLNQNPEDTMNLGGGTASLAYIHGDLNASILSTASGASNTSNMSDASSAASSSDVMNQTSLSDTHELSTSNFILSTKVRGIVRERARSLGFGDAKKHIAGMGRYDESAAEFAEAKQKSSEEKTAEELGYEEKISGQERSMTLPDLTLGDLDDLLANADDERKKKNAEVDNEVEGDEMLEFSSHQRGTPGKKNLSLAEDSTASSLGLDDVLAAEGEVNETGDLSLGLSSIKSVDNNGEQQSFTESTASQNYLDQILNDKDEENEESKPKDNTTTQCAANQLANATPNTNTTPNLNNSTIRQSPSFLSGKKKALPWRKSMGEGDLAKIRALTASLKKGNLDKMRMSLPAVAKPAVMEMSVAADGGVKESTRALFPAGQKPIEKETIQSPQRPPKSPSKSPRPAADSPARNTRNSKKSPNPSDEMMEFTSHQRNTPGKKRKDLAMLDESTTDSSLGLDAILANISTDTEKSAIEETGNVSLGLGSPKQSPKPPRSPSRKSSVASPMDSPARNTRSAKKSPSPSVDSPGRHTRSAKKSKSPSPADSPARNTRSAKKSPAETSPARSLFNSPLSPSVFRQLGSPAPTSPLHIQTGDGPFSGRKRNYSPSSDARKPSKKRLSLEGSLSEPSDEISLSKEFPFLSQQSGKSPADKSPLEKAVTMPEATATMGTNTMEFNQLMQDIDALPDKSTLSEGSNADMSSSGLSSFSGDDSISSAKQVRNKRRETADLNELALILGGNRADATSSEAEDENVTPPPAKLHTPRAGSIIKTPKSILNSTNKRSGARSNKKNVMFGSPELALYNIGSPSASFTPMHPKVQSRNETEDVEQTTELEGDITQMIAKASDPALMEPIDESRIEAEFPSDASAIGLDSSRQLAVGERTEELETNIYSLVNISGDESEFSLPSISEDSANTPSNVKRMADKSADSSMDIEETVNFTAIVNGHQAFVNTEATQTVALEGNMASLLDAADADTSAARKDNSQTMEIEGTLASLYNADSSAENKENSQTMDLEGTVASLLDKVADVSGCQEMSFKQSRKSLPPAKPTAAQESNFTYSTLTIPIDSGLEALVGATSSQSVEEKSSDLLAEPTCTIPLDANLQELLDGASSAGSENNGSIEFSRQRISGDDDTVSELGMNTSQEFSNNSEVQSSLDKIAEEEPAEPFDMELEELVEYDVESMALDDQQDAMLNSLAVASRNAISPIKRETEDVLNQVCTDIESQISMIGVDADYASIIERKQDAMRVLQQNVRSKDENTRNQVKKFLQAVHASTLSEWDSWLTQVASLYNDQLLETAVGEMEQYSLAISDKTSDINYNREQVALPMLLRSANIAAKRNYERQQVEMHQLDAEVAQLEADLKEAEQKLEALSKRNEAVGGISKSAEESQSVSGEMRSKRKAADSAFYKFFSAEKLHNWIITSSNDSFIGIVFNGSASEMSLHLSFWITESFNTAFDCKIGPLPRSVHTLIGKKQIRYHPAVSGFLSSKMNQLCQDLKEKTRIDSASKISPLIQFVEHRVARIDHAAKEFDSILSQCKNSFLQPSETCKDGFDFHAYITSKSQGARVQVTLTLSECYPFAPIGVRLHSTDTSFDTESLTRQLQKIIKPGFGALTKAIDVVNSMLV